MWVQPIHLRSIRLIDHYQAVLRVEEFVQDTESGVELIRRIIPLTGRMRRRPCHIPQDVGYKNRVLIAFELLVPQSRVRWNSYSAWSGKEGKRFRKYKAKQLPQKEYEIPRICSAYQFGYRTILNYLSIQSSAAIFLNDRRVLYMLIYTVVDLRNLLQACERDF